MIVEEQKFQLFLRGRQKLWAVMMELLSITQKTLGASVFIPLAKAVLVLITELTLVLRLELWKLWPYPYLQYLLAGTVIYNLGFDQLNMERVLQTPSNFVSGSVAVMCTSAATIAITVIFATGLTNNRFVLLFYTFVMRLQRVLCVVMLQVAIAGWRCSHNCTDLTNLIKPIVTVLWLISTAIVAIYTTLCVCPVAKVSLIPSVGNSAELAQFYGGLLKVLVITFGGITNSTLFTLVTIDAVRLCGVYHSSLRTLKVIAKTPWIITFITELVCFLASTFQQEPLMFFVAWLSGLVLALVYLLTEYSFSYQKLPMLPSCCKRLNDFDLLQLVFAAEPDNRPTTNYSIAYAQRYFQTALSIHIKNCVYLRCYLRDNHKQIVAAVSGDSLSEGSQSSQHPHRYLKFHMDAYLLTVLQRRVAVDPNNLIMLCLHLHNQGQSYKLKILCKKRFPKIAHRFAAEYLLHLTITSNDIPDEYLSPASEDKYLELKKSTLDHLKQLIKDLRIFVSELNEKKLRLRAIETRGNDCYNSIQILKQQFMRLQKFNRTDIRLTEFYLELFENILQHRRYVEETVKSIKQRHATKKRLQKFSEVSAPAVKVEGLDRNRIAAMNAYAIKLLRTKKETIVEDGFTSLLVPPVDPANSRYFFERASKEALMCLIKTVNGETLIPVELHSRIRDCNSKRYYFYEIVEQYMGRRYSILLVNNKDRTASFYPYYIYLQDGIFNIRKFYQMYLQQREEGCKIPSRLNFSIDQGDILLQVHPCVISDIYFIRLELFENLNRKSLSVKEGDLMRPARITSLFNFRYDFDKKPTAVGSFYRTLASICQVSHQRITIMNEAEKINYAKGVRIYRLLGDRIYSTYLYSGETPEECEGKATTETIAAEGKTDRKLNMLELVMYVLIVLVVALVTAGLVIDLIAIQEREQTYKQYFRIKEFEVRFYNSLCIIRDAVELPTKGWYQLLLYYIEELQIQYEESTLFSNQFMLMNFKGVAWKACLDELCNIIIAELYLIAKNGDLSSSGYLFRVTLMELAPMIVAEHTSLERLLQTNLQTSLTSSYITLVSVVCVFVAFILVLLFQDNYREQRRQRLMLPFRVISDEQLRSLEDRLNTFEALLEMSERNEYIEVAGQMKDYKLYRPRQTPRRILTLVGEKRGFIVLTVLTIMFLLVVFGYVPMSRMNSNEYPAIKLVGAISDIYPELSKYSLPNPNLIKFENNPSKFLDTIYQYYSFNLFSDEYNQQIFVIFFQNCCLDVAVPGAYCYPTFANGSNPFLSGLLYYFNNLVFELVDNKYSVYASTGAMAEPFRNVFLFMINRNNIEIGLMLQQKKSFVAGYAVIEYLFAVTLALIGFVRWYDDKRRIVLDEQALTVMSLEYSKEVKDGQNQDQSLSLEEDTNQRDGVQELELL